MSRFFVVLDPAWCATGNLVAVILSGSFCGWCAAHQKREQSAIKVVSEAAGGFLPC
jgi:hypothetical protein